MPFEFLAHTGDIAVRVWAGALPELFEEGVLAFTAAVTDVERVEPRETRVVACAAAELDLLLHDCLSELVFYFERHRWIPARASVTLEHDGPGWRLDARLSGERYDPGRHPLHVVVKAVTYHELAVAAVPGGWQATVVFDI